MYGTWAAAVARRPVAFLAANLAIVVLAGAVALGAPDRLAVSGGLERGGNPPGPDAIVVLTPDPGTSSEVTTEALAVIRSGLLADPRVRTAESRESRGGATTIVVETDASTALERRQIAERVTAAVDPGPFALESDGEQIEQARSREVVEDQLPQLAVLVLPLVLVVLLLAFGIRHIAAPVLAAATGALGAIALLRVMPASFDLPAIGLAVAAGVGLAVGVEACHLARSKAEQAGRPVAWACSGAALAALILILIPVPAALSAALGGAFAALLAGVSALVATPALDAVFPDEAGDRGRDRESIAERIRYSRFGAIYDEIAYRPWLAGIPALATIAGLCLLGAPAVGIETVPAGAAAGDLIDSRLPWIAALLTLAGIAVGWIGRGSLRLGLAHGAGAALPAVAACGLLVLAAEGSLPFDPGFVGVNPSAWAVLAVLAAVGAVSVARAALGGGAGALAGTLVAGAALGALAGIEIDAVAQAGAAVAAGLVIDLVLVRAILAPSLGHALPDRLHR